MIGRIEAPMPTEDPLKAKYREAHVNLMQPNCDMWHFLMVHPERTFLYGEDGYGLILPGATVYVASGYADHLSQVIGEPTIRRTGRGAWLENQMVYLDNKLPSEVADEILEFSRDMRQTAKALNRAVRQGKLQRPRYPLVIDWMQIDRQH